MCDPRLGYGNCSARSGTSRQQTGAPARWRRPGPRALPGTDEPRASRARSAAAVADPT
jgi:hypothetical protein